MPADVVSNVLSFPSAVLSRHDRALIEQWRAHAEPLGVAGVRVRDNGGAEAERIAIEFRRGDAAGHFIMIQRARNEREWVSVLLRVEADGSMTLPIERDEAVRQDNSLRDALNAVRPVLPDQDCRVFDYTAARRERLESRERQRVATA